MKLFGNGGRPPKDEGRRQPARPQAQKPAGGYAPKPANQKQKKKTLTRKQKVQRTVIIIVAVIAVLCVTGAAVWMTQVRAPKGRPAVSDNNNSIQNAVDGDEPSVDMGDRIANYFTFVVGAVDEDETRTDALMVVGFDTVNKKVNILNIPRDTMCNNNSRGASRKINAAYGMKKGIEQTKKEIQRVIGFQPDYYIIVNFKGIADIVDAIGGVDYEVPFRMYYKDPTQNLDIDFKPGMTHMDGGQVVEFLRWRKNNGGVKTGDPNYTGGDEERITKQQEFLKYLATQVLDGKNATKIPAIAQAVFDNVKTDFTWGEMLWMAQQATGMDSTHIQMHTLPGYDSYSYAGTSDYLSFFFPNERETLALVNEYFNPYVNKLTNLDIVSGPDRSSGSRSSSSSSSSKPKRTEKPEEEPEEPTDPEETPDQPDGSGKDGGSSNPDSGSADPDAAQEPDGTKPSGGGSSGSDSSAGTDEAPPDPNDSGSTSGSGDNTAVTPAPDVPAVTPPADTPAPTPTPPAAATDPEA